MLFFFVNWVDVTLITSGVEIGPDPHVCSTEQIADEKQLASLIVKKS